MKNKEKRDSQNASEPLRQSLIDLDLAPNEITLYLASLSLGPKTIAALAAHLGMRRPNLYKIITQLEARGLAHFTATKRKRRTFMVEPPTKVRELLQKKREGIMADEHRLVSAIPGLMARYRQGEGTTKIKFFESRSEWMDAFFGTLNEATQIDWFGNYHEWVSFVTPEQEQSWIEKRIKKGIPIRLLMLPSKEGEVLANAPQQFKREYRLLNSALSFDCSFQIYANKVLMWQPKTPLAVLIEDEYFAQMYRAIFATLWEKASEDPNIKIFDGETSRNANLEK
jgi:sugar-specific transcriptional regulator TrmB